MAMNLVGRGPNGRLDALSACELLCSGAVTFGGSTKPSIHDDVIGFYSLRHDAVAAVLPDLLDLLHILEADAELCVPATQIAEAVRAILPQGDLTGMGLFLLQDGAHPLVIERAGHGALRIRYDERLTRGVPRLQQLLCRMVALMLAFCGRTDVTILFERGSITNRTGGIADFEGWVAGAAPLEERAKVVAVAERVGFEADAAGKRKQAPEPDTASKRKQTPEPDNGNPPERYESPNQPCGEPQGEPQRNSPPKKSPTSLESGEAVVSDPSGLRSQLYTLHELRATIERRVDDLSEAILQTERDEPSPNDPQYQAMTPHMHGIMSDAKAARSFVLHALVYMVMGIVIFVMGQRLLTSKAGIIAQIMSPLQNLVDSILETLGLPVTLATQTDISSLMGMPLQTLEYALNMVGITLMVAAIVLPIRLILKYRRRLSRELAATRSHRLYMTALAEKHSQKVQITYNMALEAWATDLKNLTDEKSVAEQTLAVIDAKEAELLLALENSDVLNDAPRELTDHEKHVAQRLVHEVECEPTEASRLKRVKAYCESF